MNRKAPTVDAEVANRELRMENKLQQEIIMQARKVNQKEAKCQKKNAEEVQQMKEHISITEMGNAKLKKHNNKLRRKISKLKKQIRSRNGEKPLMTVMKHQRRYALPGELIRIRIRKVFTAK